MKKILSLLLVGIMVVSMIPTAFATTDVSNGTQVVYDATADNDGDGQPDHAEAYTVTVPAQLAPGGSGNVTASGTWASNRKLTITADENVTLTNSINAADQKVLDVTFPGIELAGSNTAAVTDTKAVSVADISAALFGTWSGTFNYNVAMSDVVDNYFTLTLHDEFINKFEYEPGTTWKQFLDGTFGDMMVSELIEGGYCCTDFGFHTTEYGNLGCDYHDLALYYDNGAIVYPFDTVKSVTYNLDIQDYS